MEYTLIIILQLIGIGFHALEKVAELDKKYPQFSMKEVFAAFFNEDWNTLLMSGLVLALNVVTRFIAERYAPQFTGNQTTELWWFGISLVLGYAGQRLVYRFFGSAEKFLNKQADKIDNR